MRQSTSPDSRIQKYGLTRSRNGCATCKSRKVKCDEMRPRCQRCTSTGRKCEYTTVSAVSAASGYGTPLSSPPLSLGLSSSRVNPSAQRERRAFEYYFYRGALSIAGALDLKFWKDTVLQLSRSEPAIWDAVIAISALYEDPDSSLGLVLGGGKNEALGWYSRSMMGVRKLIEQNKANKEIAVVTCVLYICIEIMQGHMNEALQLYEQGVSLIYELRASAASRMSFLEDTIIPLFFRMGTAALSTAGLPVVKDLFALADHSGCFGFFTVEAARAALALLTRESVLFRWEADGHILEVGSAANVPAEIIVRQQNLLLRLEDWYNLFTGLANNQPNPMYQSAISIMRTFHATMYIMLSTCLMQRETAFDAYRQYFRTIVENASQALATSTRDCSQAPFTFELGVGQPLFFTAMSCRDPVLRREALALLRRVPQEGFFQCAPRVASAEEYIRMEEGGISGLMVRMSNVAEPTAVNDLSEDVEHGVREIPLDRLANLPNVEDLVTIEDDSESEGLLSGSEQFPIPEGNRIRKNVVVQLHSRTPSFDGRPQSQPFLHLTRNRRNSVNGAWEEREYFLPLNVTSIG